MSDLTVTELKSRGEFFKKGSIIPQRILKGRRKAKHFVVFGCDSWVIPAPMGYVVMVNSAYADCAIRLRGPRKNCKQLILRGSPYSPKGITKWIGNALITDKEWASRVAVWLGERA
ncbi:hypothetical protein [Yersinia massiliensis]|uniref:Phage protein n=1 Tax=Yersinia massiliensis TaxID=419257 RepID=A0ABM6USB0_9GAMM|nr:hypothetical protein [Yersinia massiliensis]AVX37804.1 hypothetical protein DA391_09095 [Yersinia massiliensis]